MKIRTLLIVGSMMFAIGLASWWTATYFAIFEKPMRPGESVVINQAQETAPSFPSNTDQPIAYQVESFVENLQVPWSIVFTSSSRMLVTERKGTVRVIENDQLQSQPIHTFSQVNSRGEEGLMGMTLDPNYAQNRYVYFCYAYPSGNGFTDKVVRLIDQGNLLGDETVVIDNIPAATNHAGCRIKFGPDEKLYVTTGDATDKSTPQNLDSLGGKILRLNPDGSIPKDNPFVDSPVYSYGHRNPQGLDWHPETGTLIATEHGPSGFDGPAGGDEINLIEPGKNYGWPVVSHERSQAGMVDPLLVFTPAVAPSAGMFYSANMFPQFHNNYLFTGLRGEGLFLIRIMNDQVESYEKLDNVNVGRVREVIQGPDGLIYFATSNRDGRGSPIASDDHIYRLVPVK